MNKSKIEHLIGFVEHKHFDIREHDGAPFDQIDQSAWRGDHNIDAVLHLFDLFIDRRPAEDGGDREPEKLSIGSK